VTLDRAGPTVSTGRHTQPRRAAVPGDESEADVADAAGPEGEPDAVLEAARITLVGAGAERREADAPTPTMRPADADDPAAPPSTATLIAPGGAPPPLPMTLPGRDTPAEPVVALAPRVTAPFDATPTRRPTAPLRVERTTGPMASPAGLAALQRDLFERAADSPDLRPGEAERLGEAAFRARVEQVIAGVVRDLTAQGRIPNSMDRLMISRHVLRELVGLGPLEDLLADVEVSDILVDRFDLVHAIRAGQRVSADPFSSERAAQIVIDRLIASGGGGGRPGPILELRLPDGARAVAILPPVAVRGPALSIRKRRRQDLTLDQLVIGGTLSSAMADLLWAGVATRRNLMVTGGIGSGKTTLLAALAAFVPVEERVLCIEDADEIAAGMPGWLGLETQGGGCPARDLVRAALRLRPDRLVVGELRGGEALEVLRASRAGLEGLLATLPAESPRDALVRLEDLLREGDPQMPARAARDLIARTIHFVVHLGRFADGVRRVTRLTELRGLSGDDLELRDIFAHVPDAGAGAFVATGSVPAFLDDPERRNAFVDEAIFAPG
jgi:pilus assembly protein CpaF